MTNPFSIREKVCRCLAWVVAICLFNSIIDMPNNDFIQMTQVEFNEIETVAEWVLEEVADIENAVPEQEEEDHQQSFLKDKQDWLAQERWMPGLPSITEDNIKNGIYNRSFDSPFCGRHFPPPKYCC